MHVGFELPNLPGDGKNEYEREKGLESLERGARVSPDSLRVVFGEGLRLFPVGRTRLCPSILHCWH